MVIIPSWLKSYLNEKDKLTIEKAIIKAETQTSGEIVPMIVRKSSTIGHVPVIIFCVLFILGQTFSLVDWQKENYWNNSFWWLINTFIFSIFSVLISKIPFIQRHLISHSDLEEQVNQRAELEFYSANLKSTRDKTGILIFLSLMEKKVVVLADHGISEKLEPSTWNNLVEIILSGVKNKNLAKGISEAVLHCGNLLSEVIPREPDDTNELKDHLIIKE